MMKENKFRCMLENHMPTVGTRIQSTWPMVTETVGAAGEYDYIEFVAEYAPYNQYDLENLVRAAELHDMASMIKVDYQNRGFVAQKALASGFQAVLFTDHRTADDVAKTLEMVTPEAPSYGGKMGYAKRRWIGGTVPDDLCEFANMASKTVMAFMIEKKEAVDNIDEICAVPGVDMIQFGPSDFAMSSGFNGKDNKDKVKAAEKKVIETALRYGVQPRCELNSAEEARYYMEMGVRHFCLGFELRILNNFLRQEGLALRSLMGEKII